MKYIKLLISNFLKKRIWQQCKLSIDAETIRLEIRFDRTKRCVQSLVLLSRNSSDKMIVPILAEPTGFDIRIPCSDILETFGSDEGYIDFYLSLIRPSGNSTFRKTREAQLQETSQLIRLGNFAQTFCDKQRGGSILDLVSIRTHVTIKGNLSLAIEKNRVNKRRGKTFIRTIKKTPSGIALVLELTAPDGHRVDSALLIVTGLSNKTYFEFPAHLEIDKISKPTNKNQPSLLVLANLQTQELISGLLEDEQKINLSLKIKDEIGDIYQYRISAKKMKRFMSITDKFKNTLFHLVPYRTFRAHNLSYRIERYAPEAFRFMKQINWVSWFVPIIRPFLGIWLIGETAHRGAQDNGYHFFKYVREKHPRRKAFYVINEKSPDRAKVERLGNVLIQRSKKHIFYSLLASRLINTHHSEYLLPTRDDDFNMYRGVRVFLQHGIIAQKNVVPAYGRQTTQEKPTECFLVTSDLEKKIIVEDYGYQPHQVHVVGLARFDGLFENDVKKQSKLLIMPTWRDTLGNHERFLKSDYYRSWHNLLTDVTFRQVVSQSGLTISFILHPNMVQFKKYFEVEGINLIRQEDLDVQKSIKQASVMITDFSSVAWDFSFLKRPVLYFLFDFESLVGNRQPHIDFQTQLPGPIAFTVEQLVANFKQTFANGFEIGTEYHKRSRAFLKYKDQNNCNRIYNTVRGAWTLRIALERLLNAHFIQVLWRKFRSSWFYSWTRKN